MTDHFAAIERCINGLAIQSSTLAEQDRAELAAAREREAHVLSRHCCDFCKQDISGQDFDGHYTIVCHKPGCATHLTNPEREAKWQELLEAAEGYISLHDVPAVSDDPFKQMDQCNVLRATITACKAGG